MALPLRSPIYTSEQLFTESILPPPDEGKRSTLRVCTDAPSHTNQSGSFCSVLFFFHPSGFGYRGAGDEGPCSPIVERMATMEIIGIRKRQHRAQGSAAGKRTSVLRNQRPR